MFAHILIATDGSELSDRAAGHGLALAKVHGAKVTAVHVTEPWTAAVAGEWAITFQAEEYEKTAAANAKSVLARVAEEAQRIGVACETFHIRISLQRKGSWRKPRRAIAISLSWGLTGAGALPGSFWAARRFVF